jgi:predicted PurR-regulated permease PerM
VLLAAALVGGYLLFHQLATLFVAVVLTLILALPLDACATRLVRRGVPRWIGALLALAVILGMLGGLLALALPVLADELQRLADDLPRLVDQLRGRLGEAVGTQPGHSGRGLQRSMQDLLDHPQRLLGPLAQIGMGVAGVLATLVVVVMGGYYMAVNPKPLQDGLLRLFPPDRRAWAGDALAEIRSAWIGWLYGVAADMVVTGVLLYGGLTLIGLDFALVFAVLSALLVVVPYFGSLAGGLPPVLFALAERSASAALLTLAVYLAVQQIEGNIIIPMVMARAVNLHPAVVLIGVVLVGQVLGFVGLMVAVPIISATIVLVRELWVRRVEGDQPAPASPPAAAG